QISIADLRRALHSSELLLEYVVSDSQSYCLAITRSHARVLRLKLRRRELEETIDRYLSAVKKKRDSTTEERTLYAALLAPVPELKSKSRLIVIPDSSLN